MFSIFSKKEKDLLSIAYETFITQEYSLKTFEKKWSSAGFEAWVVGELLIQLEIRGKNPIKKQKPDLLVDNINVEIKGCAHGKNAKSAYWLIRDYTEHNKRNVLHLWVFSRGDILEHLYAFFRLNSILCKKLTLGESGWIVMISKQTHNTPSKLINLKFRDWNKSKDNKDVL